MKKFAFVLLFVGAVLSFSFSATEGDLIVTGSVAQQLSVSLGSDVAIGSLNTAGAVASLGNLTARSNIRDWTLQFKADNGMLTLWEGSTPAYNTTEQIGYTFSFVSAGAEDLGPVTLGTDWGNDIDFARKTSGGSAGETFAISIDYDGEAEGTNNNWVLGTYRDTIYVKVISNL